MTSNDVNNTMTSSKRVIRTASGDVFAVALAFSWTCHTINCHKHKSSSPHCPDSIGNRLVNRSFVCLYLYSYVEISFTPPLDVHLGDCRTSTRTTDASAMVNSKHAGIRRPDAHTTKNCTFICNETPATTNVPGGSRCSH